MYVWVLALEFLNALLLQDLLLVLALMLSVLEFNRLHLNRTKCVESFSWQEEEDRACNCVVLMKQFKLLKLFKQTKISVDASARVQT